MIQRSRSLSLRLANSVTVTVTEALVLRPLLEDRGRITESIRILVGTLKSREWKTREWKSWHQNARLEIAGEGKVWKAKVLKCVSDYID